MNTFVRTKSHTESKFSKIFLGLLCTYVLVLEGAVRTTAPVFLVPFKSTPNIVDILPHESSAQHFNYVNCKPLSSMTSSVLPLLGFNNGFIFFVVSLTLSLHVVARNKAVSFAWRVKSGVFFCVVVAL